MVGKYLRYAETGEYLKVLGVEGRVLQVWRFETYEFGKIEIEPNSTLVLSDGGNDGYEEIGAQEFNAAWVALMEGLERL
jgi:hypothetical protein